MKKKNFLVSMILSTLLLTANVSAQKMECKDGKCFISINKLTPTKNSSGKIKHFKMKKMIPFKVAKKMGLRTIQPATEKNRIEIIAFDHSAYIKQENEHLEIVENEPETIVLSPGKYIMSQTEIEEYYGEEINIEDKIMKKSTLPTSEYYCKNHKKAVYNKNLNAYQCTI